MKKIFSILCLCLALSLSASSCSGLNNASAKQVSITLWHNYGGQLKETMDNMIDEFNETVGLKEGIIINVTSISGSSAIHDKLVMAANGDPGAPSLPDITTLYPKTAVILAEKDLLADLNEQFTPEELSAYLASFIQEGIIGNKLYVFPSAKSTEVIFLNKTIFDRFADDAGVSLEDLYTFEGIARVAALYYDWTDRQTPDTENDGKMFFMPDSLFNLTLTGYRQFDSDFIREESLDMSSPLFKKFWDFYYKPAVLGQMAIFDGYATDLAKTGDIVCSIGSTAGISFFSPTVTYPDNTTEEVDLAILPYPTFEGGEKVVLQRGSGMSVIKSDTEREKKAAFFIKWFTSPENNIRFISSTGYLPVTKEAFNRLMNEEYEEQNDSNIAQLRRTTKYMQEEYTFFTPPVRDDLDELQNRYELKLKESAAQLRSTYIENNSSGSMDSFTPILNKAYSDFIQRF